MEESGFLRGLGVRTAGTLAAVVLLLLAGATTAGADFPYVGPNGALGNPTTWKLPPGVTPSNFGDNWKLAATPEASPTTEAAVNGKADELCGIRGMSVVDDNATFPLGTNSCVSAGSPVKTAFEETLGRPDVLISVLDSGIEWNDQGAMIDLRKKIHLNAGELPAPRVDLHSAFDPSTGVDCAAHFGAVGSGGDYNRHGRQRGAGGAIPYDVIHQGVFNTLDYACDSRVAAVVDGPSPLHALRHGPAGMLTPEDLILAFSDGVDHDGNGFASDIAGWNFVDNNNDPFDDVQYGHGTGEAEGSSGEANTTQNLGTCPDCEVMPLRVGESFVTDDNRFAQAALYAVDMGSSVISEALGTYNDSYFARQAVEYAYHHGVAVIASAADEAAEHHNEPGSLPDTIVVNSVNKYDSTLTNTPPSYLQFNGCTNFSTHVTISVSSSSCSSNATELAAGIAGLVYSAAENAVIEHRMAPASDCHRVDGSACPITANEVRQLMASGNIAGDLTPGQSASTGTTPADAGDGGQADDVNFALQPEGSCTASLLPTCTDPNSNTTFAADQNGGIVGPFPDTRRYHARKGFDEFYGYGRLNAYKAVAAAANGTIPPEADITSPDWFQQVDPRLAQIPVTGYVNARTGYTCRVQVAPGGQPNNAASSASPAGDFVNVGSTYCDGTTVHTAAFTGTLARIRTSSLEGLFPSNVRGFDGNENGGLAQTSNGRPNTMPFAFTVRVVVRTAAGSGRPAMTGEDRRQLFLHRDQDMLPGWPKELESDGDSSPLLIDLAGSDRNQLIVATSDGLVHAYTRNGTELPGWPVHTAELPLHTGELAYKAVGTNHYCAILGALAGGDLFHDGQIEIVADDLCGNVYAWNSQGRLVFHEHSNPAYSGAPLKPFHTVRQGPRDRTETGFLASPVLGRLDGKSGGPLDIIAAGEDRHVYAWQPDPGRLAGRALPGFPVLLADPDKITEVAPATNHLTFSAQRAGTNPDIDQDQGKIIDTPALAQLDGPGKPATIIVGSNEEYLTGTGDEGQINAGSTTASTLTAVGSTGALTFANGRVYAIRSSGGRMSCSGGRCHSTAFRTGWPVKVGIVDAGLLPDVGEGVNGSPVVAPLTCPSGGQGMKIGLAPDAGPAYILNPDGSSCYGKDSQGKDNPLDTDFSNGNGQYDHPAFAAVGYPAFGSFNGHTIDFFTPEAGLLRALDLAVNEYQGGQDFIGGWDTSTAQSLPGFPAAVNDLQFLTGPVVGQITASGSQAVIGGTSSLDLAAFNSQGLAASSAWPKLTGDWTVATPTLGSFGTLDSSRSARKDIVSITRAGTVAVYTTPAPACSPSSSPRFHHDDWNSGAYLTDAVTPGRPLGMGLRNRVYRFRAPGQDLMCGRVARYQVVTSRHPITAQNFASARPLKAAPTPKNPYSMQSIRLSSAALRYVAVRAVDAAGNVGLPAVVTVPPGH